MRYWMGLTCILALSSSGCILPYYELEVAPAPFECPCACERCEADEVDPTTEECPQGGPRFDEEVLVACGRKETEEDREGLLQECSELCDFMDEQDERLFQNCESTATGTDDMPQAEDAAGVCSEFSLYSDGRTNVGDAALISIGQSSSATFTLAGVSVSTPIRGRARLFLDDCTSDAECHISLADFVGQADGFVFPGVEGFAETSVSELKMITGAPAPGRMLPGGIVVFDAPVQLLASAKLGGEAVGTPEISLGAAEILGAQIDLSAKTFQASIVHVGAFDATTVLHMVGTVENVPPKANVSVVEAGCPSVLSGTSSTDLDGDADIISFAWYENATGQRVSDGVTVTLTEPGAHDLALIVADRALAHDRRDVAIEVVNTKPTAVITGSSTIECSSPSGGTVTLSAASSFDPDGAPLAGYSWLRLPGGTVIGTGPELMLELPLGHHQIGLSVTDACGGRDVDVIEVDVVDTTPPTLTDFAYSGPVCLWPPNHDYAVLQIDREFTALVTDVCDPAPQLVVLSAESSQPEDATGDGSTLDDVILTDEGVCLRSERQGNVAEPRVYSVHLAGVDASGNAYDPVVEIEVGHDQRPARRCLEDVTFVEAGDALCQARSEPAPDAPMSAAEASGTRVHGCSGAGSGTLPWGLLALVSLLKRRRQPGR